MLPAELGSIWDLILFLNIKHSGKQLPDSTMKVTAQVNKPTSTSAQVSLVKLATCPDWFWSIKYILLVSRLVQLKGQEKWSEELGKKWIHKIGFEK
jgi:hypothetical protein